MGAQKTRFHKLTVTVRFDRPVYRKDAVRAFNNNFYGEGYPDTYDHTAWSVVKLGKAV